MFAMSYPLSLSSPNLRKYFSTHLVFEATFLEPGFEEALMENRPVRSNKIRVVQVRGRVAPLLTEFQKDGLFLRIVK